MARRYGGGSSLYGSGLHHRPVTTATRTVTQRSPITAPIAAPRTLPLTLKEEKCKAQLVDMGVDPDLAGRCSYKAYGNLEKALDFVATETDNSPAPLPEPVHQVRNWPCSEPSYTTSPAAVTSASEFIQ